MNFTVWPDSGQRNLWIKIEGNTSRNPLKIKLLSSKGEVVAFKEFGVGTELVLPIPDLPTGLYYCSIYEGNVFRAVRTVALGD